jgi:hypothetical protein
VLLAVAGGVASCLSGGDGGGAPDTSGPPPALQESRQFRAIAGVSMGAYGAMNLGTKHADVFSTIAALGGPVDMKQLLRDMVEDNLEVKAQTEIPREVGDDFTYDHLPPYPDRDTRVIMFQDLTIAFGNPFLHHPDSSRRYLAIDSEPAMIRMDDQLGEFEVLDEPRGFEDGGDENEDGVRQIEEVATLPTDVGLLAVGSLPMIVSGAEPVSVGGRAVADLDGDGVFDVGDGIVINRSEPFEDGNDNAIFEPDLGETFTDSGLDGVDGSGDFGEGNAQFDYDPDRANWLEEDPLTRVAERPAEEIGTQRIYMDVGTEDEFEFAAHYDNFVAVLESKGFGVDIEEGFPSNCADLGEPDEQFLLVRYNAGHIGVATVDPADLFDGSPCGEDTVWQRLVSMIGFLNESFPDGFFGPGGDFDPFDIDIDFDDPDFDIDIDLPDPDLSGKTVEYEFESPALASPVDGSVPTRSVLVYRPPAFFRTNRSFPAVYFLGGYGQEPEDFQRIGILLDALILTGQLQNMYFVFLPGNGGRMGSFYVNQQVPESQVPEAENVTSGRYEDSILQDLIPAVENEVLERRVRS